MEGRDSQVLEVEFRGMISVSVGCWPLGPLPNNGRGPRVTLTTHVVDFVKRK